MFRNLADNPLLLMLLILIIVLVFGANKLPGAARSLGRSMRIFKSEMREMRDDDGPSSSRPSSSRPSSSGTAEPPLQGRVIEHGEPRVADEAFEDRRSRSADTDRRDS